MKEIGGHDGTRDIRFETRTKKFEEILPLLQGVRGRAKPTTVDVYEVFCAVVYLLRTGCQRAVRVSATPPQRQEANGLTSSALCSAPVRC
jgi:hypothetical protein